MDEFFKMDVFFVVTTVVVVLLGIFVLVALYYLIRILRNVEHISENVSAESDSVREDIKVLRGKIRDEGLKWKHFADLFFRVASRKAKRPKKSEIE